MESNKLSWDQVFTLITQKGATGAIVFVSVKLVFEANLENELGVRVVLIGASLLAVAAILEYLTFYVRATMMTNMIKEAQKQIGKSQEQLLVMTNDVIKLLSKTPGSV